MTRTVLTTLTALSLTLVAAQANAANYLKFEGLDGDFQVIARGTSACEIDNPCFPGGTRAFSVDGTTTDTRRGGRDVIIIESMMHDADRGGDADAGRDAAGG